MVRMLRAGMWRRSPAMLGLDGPLGTTWNARPDQHSARAALAETFGPTPGSRSVDLDRRGERSRALDLETGTDSNIAFYRKRGFEIVGQAALYGYTLTGMLRQPR